MDRINANVGFTARVELERTTLVGLGDVGEHEGKVCPGTNIKPFDDVEVYGQVVRVVGGNPSDPTYFYASFMDWTIANSFSTGTYPAGDIDNPLITGRAPADPADVDPTYYIVPTP